eukprot:TRINITY_DN7805_c0_g4_i2.p1 TRINITY_DN7805_c0_g4~~TRINITY_DN7805_c0_g4_i2.p1  ORF type:complete len:101 (-),score=23.18 TRINITY_DN7805_c0_g4_i2:516-818(-)
MDWKASLITDQKLKPLTNPPESYNQQEFETKIANQNSIGDLKLVNDKLQDSLELLNKELSSTIHQHLPLLMSSVDAVLKGFEDLSAEAEDYKSISSMIDM